MYTTIVRAPNGIRYTAAVDPNSNSKSTSTPPNGWPFPIPPIFETEERGETEEHPEESNTAAKKTNWLIFLGVGIFALVMVFILKKK